MSSFTNYPILISESMNPFLTSVTFKCDKCGKISKNLDHVCFEKKEHVLRESFWTKIRKSFAIHKIKKQEV